MCSLLLYLTQIHYMGQQPVKPVKQESQEILYISSLMFGKYQSALVDVDRERERCGLLCGLLGMGFDWLALVCLDV